MVSVLLLAGTLPALAGGDGTAATAPKEVLEAFDAQPGGWDYILLSRADGIWLHRSWVRHVGNYPSAFLWEGEVDLTLANSSPELYNIGLVPLRALAEFMGYQVDWESDSRTIRLSSGWPTGGAIETLIDDAIFSLDSHEVTVQALVHLTVYSPLKGEYYTNTRKESRRTALFPGTEFRPIIVGGRTYVPLNFFLNHLQLFPKQLQVIYESEDGILLRESSPG